MFAVPGWSVSADTLKTQRPVGGEAGEKSPKKRKRDHGKADGSSVDVDRLPELWERHIEKKARPRKAKEGRGDQPAKEKKKKHPRRDGVPDDGADRSAVPHGSTEVKSKAKRRTAQKEPPHSAHRSPVDGSPEAPPPPAPATGPLTPLQSSMRDKLISSRFRYLNETLYTTPSHASRKLFADNPAFFDEYHRGFRRQVAAWPENPVDGFLRWIRERGPVRRPPHPTKRPPGRGPGANDPGDGDAPAPPGPKPLPRDPRGGLCTIADIGCGEARLAQVLTATPPSPPLAQKLQLRVHSFDLAAASPLVTVADARHLPLGDASVDVAVFCLALMGTDWVAGVAEAARVLRARGECWVAEVGSRFGGAPPKGRAPARGTEGRKGKERGPGERGREENEPGTVEEVTTVPRSGPDVAAFVALLRRRGLALQGEADVSNKMFVRMRFVKVGNPLKAKAGTRAARRGKKWAQDAGEEVDSEEEAKALKPCVYKTR